jgi:eukaryotic-like serine/threonine-protein kinase
MNVNAAGLSIEEIYFAALEYDDSGARAAYLNAACGIDTESRRRVERLLDARSERGGFLEPPAPESSLSHECLGTVIGPYKLLEVIGEGGMGMVYLAEQTQPVRRMVALKIIKPGMDTKQVIARFEAERQALALMDHPNIARVLEAGATESGLPYFVMELVRGISITEYCDQHRLSINDRLDLFILVCLAVQHAHQKGIIHRDIKPSNVLITLHDGVPVPKVIDFGIAKAIGQSLTDKTLFTGFAHLIGTPLYMSPEQAGLSGIDVDTRSDIYSLGVLLYELLTGSTPFDQETFRRAAFDEIRRIIREQEPLNPSTRLSGLGATLTTVSANRQTDARKLNRSLHGELDWITMKALEKDPSARYATARELAEDLRRFLEGRPIQARRPSVLDRVAKWSRRHTAAVTSTAVLLAVTVMVLAVGAALIARERDAARAALTQARVQRRRAESSLVAALDAVHRRIVTVGDPDQAGREGLSERQRQAAEDAIWFYQNLLSRGVTDPTSGLEQGDVYVYLASVYRLKRDPDAALATLGKAIAAYRTQVDAERSDWDGWANLGQGYNLLGQAFWEFGRPGEAVGPFQEASRAYHEAVRLAPNVARALNYLAWFLILCPDRQYRDPAEALALSDRAVRLSPEAGNVWNTLGIARYRTGDWEGAIKALRRSMDLNDGGDGIDWFFLAMALSRKGDRAAAAEWYRRATEWAGHNDPYVGEIRRVRAEAAEALGQDSPGTTPINR